MPHNALVAAAVSVLVLSAAPVFAQSAAELLEKGIYLEETAGQIHQAIAIYRQIVTDATAHRAHVAEALFRLGMCHLEKGDDDDAVKAFERILAEYPEQEPFAARAREHMPADPEPLELLPAPWENGEVLRLALKLASGTPIGAMLLTADATERGGEELWRLRTQHKVFSDTTNQAVREVLARRDTMTPVASVFSHSTAGRFEAEYGDGTVSVETIGAGAKREEKLDGPTFDSEEAFHLFRRLPPVVGYKRTIQFISIMAGGASPIDVEITAKETITVPAGEFECYRVELSVPQVFWVSTDPSRVLVKFEASGIVTELAEVYVREPGRQNVYSDELVELSLTLPPDWLFHELDLGGTEVLFLFDPNAEAQTKMEIRHKDGNNPCVFQAAAHHRHEQAKAALHDYALRDGTWSERRHAGWPAVSFAGDYRDLDTEKVHYWTFIENEMYCVEFTLKVAADRFEALRTVFDSIIESYEGPPPPVTEMAESSAAAAIEAVLADFHLAVAGDDSQRSLENFARDAIVFLPGVPERFGVDRLRERFSDVVDWLRSTPWDRHVTVADDESLAWFDERLENARYGELRGSGVLRQRDGWEIVQYHVAFPVPNELLTELIPKLRAHAEKKGNEKQPAGAAPPVEGEPAGSASAVLRDIHAARTEGDRERYFGYFAPDAVFLGTARSERLTLAGYRALVEPYYSGPGPPSILIEQHVHSSPDQDLLWFDELFEREGLGPMRGTGVMARIDGDWKFLHYNRGVLVPNELAEGFARRIEAFYAPDPLPAMRQGGPR